METTTVSVSHFIFLHFLASAAGLFKEQKNKLAAAQRRGELLPWEGGIPLKPVVCTGSAGWAPFSSSWTVPSHTEALIKHIN